MALRRAPTLGRDERDAAGAGLEAGAGPGEWMFSAQATFSGVDVPLRLGAQSWGTLNAARDNAVLVCHYYTGTMRAAGTNPDGTPGWWAALIGPGLPLDTDRFFVICMNTPSNVQARDSGIVTTGPDTPTRTARPGDRDFQTGILAICTPFSWD